MRRLVNARELRKQYEMLGARETVSRLTEALEKGDLQPADFSIRDLAEGMIPDGGEFVRSLDPRFGGGSQLLEAATAVNTADFSNITGQIVYNEIKKAYENPRFVWPKLCSTQATQFNGERIPGVSNIGDKATLVEENGDYPLAGVSEDYIDTPATSKRGLIVPITKEAIFFDRTNLVLDRCRKVGEALGINKEKRVIDLAIGATNNYKWKGTAYSTYQATTPWINIAATNTLSNYTNIDAAFQKFINMVDPFTGEPILIIPNAMIVHSTYRATALAIQRATQVKRDPNSNLATAKTVSYSPTPIDVNYDIISSPFIDARYTAGSIAATTWYLGDFQAAFAYMENWPITVAQQSANADAEFYRDIVSAFKASERGVAAVIEPRKSCQSNA